MHLSFMTLLNTKCNCPHPGRARRASILVYCGLIDDLEYILNVSRFLEGNDYRYLSSATLVISELYAVLMGN